MAGDWLKLEASTPEKEEVLAITARLGWDDADLTVGKLFRLWRWFDQQTTNGNAPRVTPALLDRIIGVSGFCEAVREVGWLQIDELGVTLPKFDRHNGQTAKSRALTAKRVAKHKGKGNDEGNAPDVSGALPREEKRRDIKKEDPPDLPKKATSDPNYRTKKTKRAPTDFQVTDDMRAWAAAECPAIDVAYNTQKFLDHTFGTARHDWTATWRNWLRTEQERRHETNQRALAGPGRRETVDDKLRRLRGEGQSRVGVSDGDVRGSVLEGVRFGA